MKYIILILLTINILLGCNKKKTIVVEGHTYTFVRMGKTNANGINEVELWERNGVTNKYYTPSLDGKFMMPLMR